MAVYSPTWIYLGHNETQINPNWNSAVNAEAGTQLTEASVVVGWTFLSNAIQAVQVTGNATNSNGTLFGRGTDVLNYTLTNGGTGTSHASVYTSHVVVDLSIAVIRADGNRGNETATLPLRGVIVQMETGDLFVRPYYQDVAGWNSALADWSIRQVTIDAISTGLNPASTNTDRETGALNATTSFNPKLFHDDLFVPCYIAGTMIETPWGEVAIERLGIGDFVLLRNGPPQPIQWIGRRRITAAQLGSTPQLRPVRIRAGAIGPGSRRHCRRCHCAGRSVPASRTG